MRLLLPTEQQQILNEICLFFENKSDFFIPDCASHVNVIDGDYEGLYGWLSINTLIGAFDDPSSHKHGKNHTTYGLLDMEERQLKLCFNPIPPKLMNTRTTCTTWIYVKCPQLMKKPRNIKSL